MKKRFVTFVKFSLSACIAYPIVSIRSMFHMNGNGKPDWKGSFIICLIIISGSFIMFLISLVLDFLRRGFEVEMYEYKTIPYEDFVTLYVEEQRDCALEYQKYTIRLEKEKEGYMCRIFGETGLVKEMAFQNQEDLLKEKIISGQTIKELWKEIDYQDTSGIVRGK